MKDITVKENAPEVEEKRAGLIGDKFIRVLREEHVANLADEKWALEERCEALERENRRLSHKLDAARVAVGRGQLRFLLAMIVVLIEFSAIAFAVGYWM